MNTDRNYAILTVGAYLNFAIAAGHVAAMFFLDSAFRYYGIDGMMDTIARHGAAIPYIITIFLIFAFVACGLYALSAAGRIGKLPLLWTGVFTIATVYLIRSIWGCVSMACDGVWDFKGISAMIVSGTVGLLYLLGGMKAYKERKK